jgi:hypothetical protein
MTPKLRAQINDRLDREGFGGNKRFRKASNGFSEALAVLSEFGIESDVVVNSFWFNSEKGTLNHDLAWSNPDDPFSPEPIRNTALFFTWTVLREGSVEAIAYLS